MTIISIKNKHLELIITTLKDEFTNIYKQRLAQLILFGSQARGDAREYSDIDILVVLKGDVNCVEEIKNNSDFISSLCLEYDAVVNCFYVSENRLNNEDNLFIKNVKQDGILL
ncbi:nucleotidyltransferase domain-containing protein [Geminocystis herdmanii]|uniref:nucleotidyltransferase domain-containing protein n=1 Tax=Geminocystis herdmanii TaxID=669359 RepID=UPI0003495FBE|nr:nucleotidyltransferase domain-containing protein [Geminocystis herdmanii]